MNPVFTAWMQLILLLAFEVALAVCAAALLQRAVTSAVWRRTIWQICVLSALALACCEVTGISRSFSGAFAGKPPAPAGTESDDANAPAIPQLADEFRQRVADRMAVNRQSSPDHAGPAFQSSPSTATTFARTDATRPDFNRNDTVPESLRFLWPGIVWFIGTTLLLARTGFTRALLMALRWTWKTVQDGALHARVRVLKKQLGFRGRIRLAESSNLVGPIAFGLFRPTIGLPAAFSQKFSASRQEVMLAHELAHLAARDPLWYLLADVAAALLWWHPLIWWTRRQLHAASETAADEASLLVADGPGVLAECLVELGGRLASPRVFSPVGVAGCRSGLGRRVERLLHLHGRPWTRQNRFCAALAKSFGPAALVIITILCTAWVAPKALTKGETMNTMRQTWKHSLAAFALLVAAVDKGDAADATRSAKSGENAAAAEEPLVTKVYQLKNSSPTGFVAIVKPTISRRSQVIPDARTGQLIVMATENELRDVDSLIEKLDNKPVPNTPASTGPNLGDFQLRGITGPPERRIALINNVTFTKGGEQEVRAGNARVKIKVQDIRDKSCIILLEGQTEPKELVLPETVQASASPDELMRRRYGQATGKKEKSRVESRLEAIVLDEVIFDRLPLAEVLRFLSDESRKRDPEKKGINFLINPNVLPMAQAVAIDPTTGTPIPVPAPEPVDMNSVIVHFNLPLRDVRLKDVIDAVVKVADKPLEYSVEEYGVVFSANPESHAASAPVQPQFGGSMPLEVRTFRVETNMFLAGLENAFGIKIDEITPTKSSAEKSWRSREVQSALRKLLTQLGINMDVPGKSVFYNDLTGIVMVRATREDLEIVRAAIETLGGTGGETAAIGAN